MTRLLIFRSLFEKYWLPKKNSEAIVPRDFRKKVAKPILSLEKGTLTIHTKTVNDVLYFCVIIM